MNKFCTKCEQTKPSTEFNKGKSKIDGLYVWCKNCDNEQNKLYYKKNKLQILKKHREYDKEYSKKNWVKNKEKIRIANRKYMQSLRGKYTSYKRSANKRKIEFNLSCEEFKTFWQRPCRYCNSEMETIGLDRIDNSSSYSVANVVSCCITCNKMKINHSQEFFLEHCHKISQHAKEIK